MRTTGGGMSSSRKQFPAVLLVLLLSACGQQEATRDASGPDAAPTTASPATPQSELPLPLRLERVLTFESGLTKLAGIAMDAQDRVYLAGREACPERGRGGVRVLDAEGKLVRRPSLARHAGEEIE